MRTVVPEPTVLWILIGPAVRCDDVVRDREAEAGAG
jgi:hypothetical protein